MTYMLGDVALGPAKVDGFDRKNTATRVPLLSNGTSTNDEVLQQGNTPPREASVSGKLTSFDDVQILAGYGETHETVTWVDPVTGESLSVYVFDFTSSRKYPRLWEYTVTLVETT